MASNHNRSIRWVSLALFAGLTGGCASIPNQVVSVARADLACDRVEVVEVSDNRYAASGCEKGAVYTRLCSSAAGCQWARLRGVGEGPQTSGGVAPIAPGPTSPREIIAAPPPAQREVIPAPPPAESSPRQVLPAPPPAASQTPTTQQPDAASAAPQQPVPLSAGTLSDPYETEVPATPIVQRSEYAPPAPLVESRPPPPARSHVWVSGYWWWTDSRWLWAPGYWCPPRYGYHYVPGSWYWSSNYWWYGPGGWARPGSTIIAYGLAPRPVRVQAVRAFTPNRVYGAPPASPRYVSGALGDRGYGRGYDRSPAPAPRAFAPQRSPLYRYPTSLSSPSRLPPSTPGAPAQWGGARSRFSRDSAPSRAYSAPAASPMSRDYNRGFNRVDSARSRAMPGPAPSFRSSPAPLRAPSRAPVVAPRGTSFRSSPQRR
jgi:hypothetical protein